MRPHPRSIALNNRFAFSLLLFFGVAYSAPILRAQSEPDYEQPPINYSTATPRDAVSRLQQRLATGELSLIGGEQAVLRAVLQELHVPVESQLMVFSKTSLQRARIRPSTPRALYFSDSVYVGWVPGGLIEVVGVDAELGPVFYSFDPQTAAEVPRKFERNSDCLRCHGGTFVRDIPGLFARSLVPSTTGEPLLRYGTKLVDDETPFEERWGGWYVTGYSGVRNHRGNAFGSEDGDQLSFPLSNRRPEDLSELFDASDYPARTSDVVALLVFEHQLSMQNRLTHSGQHCRKMLVYQRSLQKAFKEPLTEELTFDSVKSVFAGAVENVVDRLLFRGAAPLPDGVEGSEMFRRTFAQGAPRSASGHSLKDLHLRGRLFANRCSYLIYSESFTALPTQLKNRILDRLKVVLHDGDPSGRYGYLESEEKERIYEILSETHPDAKARWAEHTAVTWSAEGK